MQHAKWVFSTALVALLLGAGTVTAQSLIDGGDVKNSSLTGTDVKNKSLTKKDFKGSLRGTQGDSGAQGAQGPQGDSGAQGAQGPQGLRGPLGLQGPQGGKGDPGDKGEAGPDGAAGPAGPQGERGPAGPQGATGQAGPGGAAGPAGPQGERGPAGPQGATGQAGPAGAAGAPGLAGVETVSHDFVLTWPNGGTGSVSDGVGCPAGKRVIGGGARANLTSVNIPESRPRALPTEGWSVTAMTPDSNTTGQTLNITITAYAICATTAR